MKVKTLRLITLASTTLAIMVAFQNCSKANPSYESPSKGTGLGTESNTGTGFGTGVGTGSNSTPNLSISCPANANLVVGTSATCNANSTVALSSGYWTIDGVVQENSNSFSKTWDNINKGTYDVQAFATTTSGSFIASNVVTVVVSSPTLIISCNSSASLPAASQSANSLKFYEGASATCSITSNGILVSGYWSVNGVAQEDSNKISISWSNISRGQYNVVAHGVDLGGNIVTSETFTAEALAN